MKELDKEKFRKTVEKARVQFGLTYYGRSNNMRVGCRWNDKAVELGAMSDEQIVILYQLVNSALTMLAKEQIRRDLLPDDVAKMYCASQVEKEK